MGMQEQTVAEGSAAFVLTMTGEVSRRGHVTSMAKNALSLSLEPEKMLLLTDFPTGHHPLRYELNDAKQMESMILNLFRLIFTITTIVPHEMKSCNILSEF